MTIPNLINCPHAYIGWCSECVSELGNEISRLRDEIDRLQSLARCECGQNFSKNEPGVCGFCVSSNIGMIVGR